MQRPLDYRATLVIAAALAGHAPMQAGSPRTHATAPLNSADELGVKGQLAAQAPHPRLAGSGDP